MLISIDKRGSINLPAVIRKELGLKNGAYLDLTVAEGGVVILHPVEIVRSVLLSEQGLNKLNEARQSGEAEMPAWLTEEMKDAEADPEPEVS
ncbi:MAG: AbrB/MazE/SpoVT family DNA-binding domain-containing protein [Syntrophales bacterium]